ncbi:MAG: M1 family aminopeptidase, partial [Flavisolibacter sp.]
LFLDSAATQDQLNSRAGLIAHETAHMWFGDLVTMEWFNDVWMKEVFANFIADKITQGNQTNNKFDLKFLIDHFPAAYGIDRTEGANPIRQPLENLQEAGSLYGNIIYHKAPIMMRQLELLMGKTDFQNGLREYLKKYQFGNATWPDLISILDKKTNTDLMEWNKLWVNDSGRPLINYSYKENDGYLSNFSISQNDEMGKPYGLPQFFKIAFVYAGHIQEFPIQLDSSNIYIKNFEGKRKPLYFLFNSSGAGYGKFPVDTKMMEWITDLQNPVMRASAYINLYENILNGDALSPQQLLSIYETLITEETEELNLSLLTRQITDIFWRLQKAETRVNTATALENILWTAMQKDTIQNKKKILFRGWQSVLLTEKSMEQLYGIWKDEKPPAGVKLNDEDYTSIALMLVLKNHPAKDILLHQLIRIKNPDRKKRFEFIIPAISPDQSVRDNFFNSLKEEKNREKETWVIAALEYLHHPLRTATSEKYLLQTLQLLEEIQKTGDIFFPYSWLTASFGFYQTPSAYKTVTEFLEINKDYNPRLKAKILQATDPLKRAKELLYDGKQSYD